MLAFNYNIFRNKKGGYYGKGFKRTFKGRKKNS